MSGKREVVTGPGPRVPGPGSRALGPATEGGEGARHVGVALHPGPHLTLTSPAGA
jgi:hypothetical protein